MKKWLLSALCPMLTLSMMASGDTKAFQTKSLSIERDVMHSQWNPKIVFDSISYFYEVDEYNRQAHDFQFNIYENGKPLQ